MWIIRSVPCVSALAACFLLWGVSVGQESGGNPIPESIDDQIERVDKILSRDTVSARAQVEEVFHLSDRLMTLGRENDAIPYLKRGLQLYPWSLSQQLTYGGYLKRTGQLEKMRECADLVIQNAEDDDLYLRAKELVGYRVERSGNPAALSPAETSRDAARPVVDAHIEPFGVILTTTPTLVLLLPEDKDPILVREAAARSEKALGVPILVRLCPIEIPEATRGPYELFLLEIRRAMQKAANDPDFQKALKESNMSMADLEDDARLVEFMRTEIQKTDGNEAVKAFDATLALGKKEPKNQWEVSVLQRPILSKAGSIDRGPVRVCAVTSRDIFAQGCRYLFAGAYRGRYLISYARMKDSFYDKPPNRGILIKRLASLITACGATSFGLQMCRNPVCPLAYMNDPDELDRKEDNLCPECRKRLASVLRGYR